MSSATVGNNLFHFGIDTDIRTKNKMKRAAYPTQSQATNKHTNIRSEELADFKASQKT